MITMGNAAVLIISTWLAGGQNGQQVVTVEVRSMEVCESMATQAREKLGVPGRYVQAECLEVKL